MCNRAGTLTNPPRRPVGLCGAQDTEIIDTVVIPETLVFRGDDRVDQQGRYFVIRHRIAVLDEDFSHLSTLAVVNDRGRLHAIQPLEIVLRSQSHEFAAHVVKTHRCHQRAEETE